MQIVTSWMREGIEIGRREGVEIGRQEGLVEGRQEGLVEGRQEGLVEGRQEGLVEGRQEGLVEGRQEGLVEGRQEGLVEGRQEGLVEGRQEGLVEGRQEEAIAFVLRLLDRKLGSLEPALRDRIERLPFEQLEALGEALLDFQDIGDLERWLAVFGGWGNGRGGRSRSERRSD